MQANGGGRGGAEDLRRLLPYLANLELEVDRLRKQVEFLQLEAGEAAARISAACAAGGSAAVVEAGGLAAQLTELLLDVRELPGYHPAHDQVIAIAIRPLTQRVFRRQQRLHAAPGVELRLELECDGIEWFPARLHHILDNLISNALKNRDAGKVASWICLSLRQSAQAYQLTVADNGIGLRGDDRSGILDLFHRAAPSRAAGLGVGLAVVTMLVEQSGGTLSVASREGEGACFEAVLPRYDMTDYLTDPGRNPPHSHGRPAGRSSA